MDSTIQDLNLYDENINTWKNGVGRALKRYIPDGTLVDKKCPNWWIFRELQESGSEFGMILASFWTEPIWCRRSVRIMPDHNK